MQIREIFKKYGIKSVYHFTDSSNLKTIKQYGIQTLYNIFNLQIPVNRFGADEYSHMLDRRKGLDRFVHLSFIKDHPMYHVAKSRGNIVDPVWIEIDISVLYENFTLCCKTVANRQGAKLFNINVVENVVDLSLLTYNGYLEGKQWKMRKNTRKAEILVKNFIDVNKIKGVTHGN